MVSLTDPTHDAELDLIKMAFEGVVSQAKLSHGWRFHVECQRRWNIPAACLRPVVAVVLENTALAEDNPKRRFAVKVSMTQVVRSRGELKPVVMETLRRCLESGMENGLREAWFEGANAAKKP